MMARTNQRIITWLHGEATKPTDEGREGMMLFAAHPSLRGKKEREREREQVMKKKKCVEVCVSVWVRRVRERCILEL